MAKQIKRQPQRKVFTSLQGLYQRMQEEYDRIASRIGLSCARCKDNCCTSYFQHHTYVEWAYLWKGLKECDRELRQRIIERAEEYVREEDACLAGGKRPEIMCPVNEDGWCTLYPFRMMICRLHGVPNFLSLPDGGHREFPGCFVTQELTREATDVPMMDRTPLYTELANLEMQFLGPRIKKLPRVNVTLARMIVSGPPKVSV